ncbi:ABC transporter G family member 51-like isoform X1 [Salvia splendens]|uniref:ABC transporter G family member 51-like isoform X1 n=1 Tax=Salvia splendens TaxID=180675 RepID=UPI001C252EB5|nr:ABC transporter G family member 51-like isoform X1 [Salvia splendens]
MESEFIALDKAGEEAEWLKNFLEDIPCWSKPVPPALMHTTLVILEESTIHSCKVLVHNLHSPYIWDNVLGPRLQKRYSTRSFQCHGFYVCCYQLCRLPIRFNSSTCCCHRLLQRESSRDVFSITFLIEIPYVFMQSLIYGLIVFSMMGFPWSVEKLAWFIYFLFFSLLYFVLYGMMTVAVTPNHNIAAIISSFFYGIWNLFSGFIIPRPRMPIWWRW